MLSRVANRIYWLARYLERAENSARLLDVTTALTLDLQSRRGAEDPASWMPLIYASGGDKLFEKLHDSVTEQAVVEFVLFDHKNPSSVFSCINYARENARAIRDQVSTETWEQINFVFLKVKEDNYARYQQLGSSEYLNRIKQYLQLFFGIADSMLPRNQAWWFYEFGRFVERADNVSRIIDVKYFSLLPDVREVGSAIDIVQWASVLRACSGFEAFRKSRLGQITLDRVVDYLILDQNFPRSIRFSVAQAEHALERITAGIPHLQGNRATDLVQLLHNELETAHITDIITDGLHEYLDHIQVRIRELHAALEETFFEYPTAGAKIFA
ncbi:MAG TPA: alpha-E domain-containing protein [Opitutaceae bacterium]|nr:alpha-E domain-containing protein [Opitutaceae bacterium]